MVLDDNGEPYKIMGTILDITDEYSNRECLDNNLKFWESLMNAIPNPVFYKDKNGIYKFCNRAFLEFLGAESDEIVGSSVYDIAPSKLADTYNETDDFVMNTKKHKVYESRLKYLDGTFHDVIFSKAVHLDENDNVIGLVGIAQDITEKKQMEKELKMLYAVKDIFLDINKNIVKYKDQLEFFYEVQIKLKEVFKQCTHSTVLKVSEDGNLTILNSVGYLESETKSFAVNFFDSFIYKDIDGEFLKSHITNNIKKFINGTSQRVISTNSGEKIKSSLSIPIYIEGSLKWIVCLDSTSDNVYSKIDILMGDYISEELPIICNLYELNSKTLYFSRYDELTGIMNRRYFDSQFEEYFLDEKIIKDEIAYVLFDLDGLKKINDAYGHLAGDSYIKKFVEFFTENIDNLKLFGRIGGDEFAAIFQGEDEIELYKKIDSIRNKFFNSTIEFEQQCFFGNFSYGISVFPRDGHTKSQIMKLADEKMYKDKNRIRR